MAEIKRIDRPDFDRLVLRLANQGPVRYYLHLDGQTDCPIVALEVYTTHQREEFSRLDAELRPMGFGEPHILTRPLRWRWTAMKGDGFGIRADKR